MTLTATLTPQASQLLTRPTASIVVPVFNEAATLEEVIRRLQLLNVSTEILIVDDGSTDGTAEHVRRLSKQSGVRTLFHPRNTGKGAAIRTALQHAAGDLIVIQDADLEYNPADIERLIQPILDGSADVVFGSRFATRGRVAPMLGSGRLGENASQVFHRVANRLLTWLSNRFTGLKLSDMETCYKAMRREVAAGLVLRENRFGCEPEITAKIARQGWRVTEIPVSYVARSRSAGKKIGVRDGLRAVWCIARYWRRD